MPSNLLQADVGFPQLNEQQSQDEKITQIVNYLYMLLEQLRYNFGNLGIENFNDSGISELQEILTEPIYARLENDEGQINELVVDYTGLYERLYDDSTGDITQLALTAQGLLTRMGDAEGNITQLGITASGLYTEVWGATPGTNSRITQNANAITLKVSQGDVDTSISTFANGLALSVSNGTSSSTIKLMSGSTQLSSKSISFSGMVTFSDLSTSGNTTINGDNITTGTIYTERLKLYGLMSVYQSKTSSSLGGYIGYSTSYFGTGGVGVLSANESGLIGAYNSGAKLIYVEPTYREAATQCAASASTLYMSAYGSGSQSYLQEQYGIRLKGFSGYAQFYPDYNTVDLGTSSYPWRNSYTTGGTWAGSDRNKKKDINYDIDSYLNVFDKLLPVSYKFKDGTSGRTHIGFIAQDVEDAILDSGMTTQDYACIAKSPKQDEEGNVIEGYDYSLRYEEFIALAIYKIKKLEARIAALEGA